MFGWRIEPRLYHILEETLSTSVQPFHRMAWTTNWTSIFDLPDSLIHAWFITQSLEMILAVLLSPSFIG